MTYLYYAVAKTLALLAKEDAVLQKGANSIFMTEVEDCPGMSLLEDFVVGLFEAAEIPELKVWQEWHEAALKTGELTLFFE